MLRGSIVDRNELLLFLSGERTPRAVPMSIDEVVIGLEPARYALLWESLKDSNSSKPPIIVVADANLREFYSFVGTYVNAYVPFSAFFRVIASSEVTLVFEENLLPLYAPEPALTHNMIGLAMVEAVMRQADGQSRLDRLTVSDVKNTLASVLLNSASVLGGRAPLREIGNKWDYVTRKISGSRNDIGDAVLDVVDNFITPLNGARPDRRSSHPGFLGSLIRDIATEGMISEHHWRTITERTPQVSGAFQSLRGPREDRIKALSNILGIVRPLSQDDNADTACVSGLAVALVADGSFQYLTLALDVLSDPKAVIWFSAWSSLFSKTDVLTVANAIGQRAARDIFVDVFLYDRQAADISFEEFRMQGSSSSSAFHTSVPGIARIEIYPTITADFRAHTSTDENRSLEDESSRRLIEETQHYLDRARVSLNRVLEGKGRYKPRSRTRD